MNPSYITNNELLRLRQSGIFNVDKAAIMDAMPGITTPNISMPAGLLTKLTPFMVDIITRVRTADKVIGRRMKMCDWAETDVIIPMIEPLGKTDPYSDFGNPSAVNLNPNFIYAGHHLFSTKIVTGTRKSMQLAKVGISAEAKSMQNALETLAIEFNNIAFYGLPTNPQGSKYPVYGLFNNPDLPAYKATSSTTDNSTFETVYKDITDMIQDIISGAKGHVHPNSKFVIALANRRANILFLINNYGQSVREMVEKNYPNVEWVLSPEFDGAYTGNLDVIYIRAETDEETLAKSEISYANNMLDSAIIGFSEIAISGAVETHSNYTEQVISSGVTGVHIFRPYMFARRYFQS